MLSIPRERLDDLDIPQEYRQMAQTHTGHCDLCHGLNLPKCPLRENMRNYKTVTRFQPFKVQTFQGHEREYIKIVFSCPEQLLKLVRRSGGW